MTQQQMIKVLMVITPDCIGFLITFVVKGQFWPNYHGLFGDILITIMGHCSLIFTYIYGLQ